MKTTTAQVAREEEIGHHDLPAVARQLTPTFDLDRRVSIMMGLQPRMEYEVSFAFCMAGVLDCWMLQSWMLSERLQRDV